MKKFFLYITVLIYHSLFCMNEFVVNKNIDTHQEFVPISTCCIDNAPLQIGSQTFIPSMYSTYYEPIINIAASPMHMAYVLVKNRNGMRTQPNQLCLYDRINNITKTYDFLAYSCGNSLLKTRLSFNKTGALLFVLASQSHRRYSSLYFADNNRFITSNQRFVYINPSPLHENHLATANDTNGVHIYDIDRMETPLHSLQQPYKHTLYHQLAYHPDGNKVALMAENGDARAGSAPRNWQHALYEWDIRSNQNRYIDNIQLFIHAPHDLIYSPSGTYLAHHQIPGTIAIRDMRSSNNIYATLPKNEHFFFLDDTHIFTESRIECWPNHKNKYQIIDITTGISEQQTEICRPRLMAWNNHHKILNRLVNARPEKDVLLSYDLSSFCIPPEKNYQFEEQQINSNIPNELVTMPQESAPKVIAQPTITTRWENACDELYERTYGDRYANLHTVLRLSNDQVDLSK